LDDETVEWLGMSRKAQWESVVFEISIEEGCLVRASSVREVKNALRNVVLAYYDWRDI
jgi:hypothetical protein